MFILNSFLIWLILIFLAPLLASQENQNMVTFSKWIYYFFQPTCHQLPDRSFMINDQPLAVCARCTSFYLGGLFIVLYFLIRSTMVEIKLKWIALFTFPAFLDFLLEKIGIYENLITTRAVTGILLGGAVIYLLLASIIQIDENKLSTNSKG